MINRLRGKTTLAVFIFITLLGHIPLLQRAIRIAPQGLGNDRVSHYEKRFEQLSVELAGHAKIGYVTNLPPDSIATDAIAVEHFYIAQYALAPSVLVLDTNVAAIVGDFESGEIPSRLAHLEVSKSYGNGLILFRGTTR